MNEAVTDIIVSRSRDAERLSSMLAWSVAAHLVVTALLVFVPRPEPAPPRTVMTISLGGPPGPTTGMTQTGGRTVQAPPPPDPVRRVDTPPAPKPPAMTLPDPKARPRPTPPKPQQAPRDAKSTTAATGAQPQEGSTPSDTGARGQRFGLSTAGGGGSGVTLDVADFCCPEFLEEMVRLIKLNWQQNVGVRGSTTMKFTIRRDGVLEGIQIEKPSGFYVLDMTAQRAVVLTARLPPLPKQFPNPTLMVRLRFDY